MINEAGVFDRALSKNIGVNVLSNEFKIFAAIMGGQRCVIKDLPSLTGLSNRTVYDILTHMQESGILRKSQDAEDRRFHLVDLEFYNFKKHICDPIAESSNTEFRCDFHSLEK